MPVCQSVHNVGSCIKCVLKQYNVSSHSGIKGCRPGRTKFRHEMHQNDPNSDNVMIESNVRYTDNEYKLNSSTRQTSKIKTYISHGYET